MVWSMKEIYDIGEMPPLGQVPGYMHAQVVRQDRYGEPRDAYQAERVEVPDVGPGEVLVYVMATGINYNGIWAALGSPVDVIQVRQRAGEPWSFHVGGSDCSGNANGPTCYSKYRKCSCNGDADCKTSPYTMCAVPYSGATYKNCQKPCTSNTDCTTAGAPACDLSSGQCVACLVNADCVKPATPVCDTSNRKCVTCLKDGDCASHQNGTRCAGNNCTCNGDGDCKGAHVWGDKCSTSNKRCSCTGSSACAGNSNGPACYSKYQKCSCTKDGDCTKAPYANCSPPYATSTYNNCQKKCAKDADCDSTLKCLAGGKCGACAKDADCSAPKKICDMGVARCVACKTTADCTGGKVCDSASGTCVECQQDSDCATNLDGGKCVSGNCSCSSDSDCKSGYAWGDTCDKGYGRCACTASSGCVGNVNGSTCLTAYKKCSCAKDGDCPNKSFSKCMAPYNGATYKHCQKPCASDKDCTSAGAPHCQGSSGKCRVCTQSSHCAANTFARTCDPASYRCIECLVKADCAAYSLGNSCVGKLCSCAKDSDCIKKEVGSKCNAYNNACGCTADSHCIGSKKCSGTTSFSTKYCK